LYSDSATIKLIHIRCHTNLQPGAGFIIIIKLQASRVLLPLKKDCTIRRHLSKMKSIDDARYITHYVINNNEVTLQSLSCICDDGLQLEEIGGPEAGDWIPASSSSETGGTAARVSAALDVVETGWVGVEEGVEEAQRGFVVGESNVIKKGDDTSESWRAGRSAADGVGATTNDNLEARSLGGDIRISTTSCASEQRKNKNTKNCEILLEQAAELGTQTVQEGRDGSTLVARPCEVARKSSSREGDGDFRVNPRGATNSGNERAAGKIIQNFKWDINILITSDLPSREVRLEFNRVFTIIAFAVTSANTIVPT
jgi:hypothetical protein